VPDGSYRLLAVSSHVVQYSAVRYRGLAAHPELDFEVCFCSLQGAEAGMDPEFGVEVAWDVPLLEGYRWRHLPNRSLKPGLGRFWGLLNTSVWNLVGSGKVDGVFVSGYAFASAWVAILSAKWHGVTLILSTDSHDLQSRRFRSPLGLWIKRRIVRHIFGLADIVLGCSQGSVDYLRSLGISGDRIVLAPFVVDNSWWIEKAAEADRPSVRESWSIPENASVLLYCAKLQPWKRPEEALEAFAKAGVPNSYLVFVGDGPLRSTLEARAKALGIDSSVRWLGLVNQSRLPSVYRASDLLVLPSEHEPFGLVVNEAMLCGCPVVVSDRVGAKYDLVRQGQTGYVYFSGDVNGLAAILTRLLTDREDLRRMGEAARRRMETWSPREYISAVVGALKRSRLAPKRAQASRCAVE